MASTISNSIGALQSVADFRTIKTTEGELLLLGGEQYARLRANATILKGQAVSLVVPTQTLPLSVIPMPVAANGNLFIGIAAESAPAGEVVNVCTRGVCEAFINAQVGVFGETLLKPGTNAGEPTRATPAFDATLISGTVIGVVLGAKNAITNLAPVRVSQF